MGVSFAGNILVQSNGGPLPIASGGTGQTTAPTAINALLPAQTGNAGKLLSTDGVNITWQAAVMSPGGTDTMIQYNDAGTFGGSANFVINKSTGALTSLSTFSGTGLFVSNAAATTRSLKFQTAGSDRWLLQATNVAETGSDVGSNFEFVRVADNGSTSNQVLTVARLSGIVDFKTTPTVNGVAMGTGSGTVSSVAGTGTVSGLTLSGTITSSGSLTLGGTLSLTSGDVTSGLGFTPYNATNPAGYITSAGTAANISGTYAGTLTSTQITSALTFTPYNATNPAGYISGITSGDVTTALGFTPYNATNPSGYTTNTGTVTSVAGTGTVSGLTLTGTVTTTGSLTLGGTLSLTSGNITTGLGYTPVNKAGDTMTGALTATSFIGPLTGNASTATNVAYSGLTGTVPTWNQNTTGNASTATVLQTARAINGVNFDGSAPITVTAAAGTLTGTTLNATVVSSSLTSVGTLAALTVTAPITGSITGSSGSTTGNAATVTNGVYTTDTGTVTNTMLAGSIANAKLLNSSVTVGTTAIALGNSSTILAGLSSVTSTGFTGALTGNASTATTLATARNISASGDATWTVSFNGSADTTAALTLTTVNASPQTDTFRKVTVNGKGLVTATSAVSSGDITTALAYTPVNKAGDTMTGALILNANPTTALGAATKQYVDDIASGVNVHGACETGTTAPLATCTYNNGSSGVGATLTATANASINTAGVGGYTTLSIGSRILVKDQVTQTQNGIYSVTDLGSAGTPWILTRATDFDGAPTTEIVAGDLTYVQEGTLLGTQWVETAIGTGHNVTPSYDYIIIGTDNIVFSQFAGAGSYTAGAGINIASNSISNTGVLSNVAGTGISVSGATGNVTIANTGVTSITGTTNQVIASASTGAITLSLPQSINSGAAPTFAGTNFTSIPNGALTNSSTTINGTSIALGASGTITAAAGTLTGTTLASNVVSSSLTSVGTLSALTVTATITGSISGNAATATSATSATSATTAGSVTNAVTFTSSGGAVAGTSFNGAVARTIDYSTLGASPLAGSASLTTTGTVTSGTWSGLFGAVSGANLTSITGANVTGTVANATAAVTAGTVTTAAQPAITSVGTLTGLTSSGAITASNLSGTNTGDNAANTTYASDYRAANFVAGTNYIAPTGSIGSATGLTSGQVTTALGFTPYNATNPNSYVTAAVTLTTAAQPNITSVGTLSALTVTATITGSVSGNAATATTANATNTANNFQMNSLGVGTAGSGTAGEIRATNNVTAYYSDDRLKTRTGKIENALDKVATLDAFYYHANETAQALGYKPIPEVGISAQQVQAIMPEVVAPAPIDDKYLTVRYERLVPLLIAAIQELQAEVAALKAK